MGFSFIRRKIEQENEFSIVAFRNQFAFQILSVEVGEFVAYKKLILIFLLYHDSFSIYRI